ncbi:hypothetical protein AAF712_016425 [Marasmius tenuissimus]|uniref:HAT C-terminal dimerisation domain-containing protein n=1 Tax=Marasmius tenuissimus TaxID=585030 RepID=A0ABR2Z5R7_9AGAR
MVKKAKVIFFEALEDVELPDTASTKTIIRDAENDTSFEDILEDELYLPTNSQSRGLGPRTEGQRYLDDTDIDMTLGSLAQWQRIRARYPIVRQLAMDILPAQGSAVPCERLFSSAKMTKTDLSEGHIDFSKHDFADLDFTSHLDINNMETELVALTHQDDELSFGGVSAQEYAQKFQQLPVRPPEVPEPTHT